MNISRWWLTALVLATWCSFAIAQDESTVTVPDDLVAEDIFDQLKPLAEDNGVAEPAAPEITPSAQIDLQPTTPPLPETRPAVEPEPILQPEQSPEPLEPEVQAETSGASSGPLSPALRDLLVPTTPEGENAVGGIKLRAQEPGELTRLNDEELRALIAYSAGAFLKELEAIEYSGRWLKFLQVEELKREFGEGMPTQADARWQITLQRYETIGGDARYNVISNRWSFQTLRLAMAEYLCTPENREARRKLHAGIAELKQSLERAPSGKHWVEFLELQELGMLAANASGKPGPQRKPLKLILSRFAQTASDSRFGVVSTLPGFQATQEQLQILAGSLNETDESIAISPAEATLRLSAIGGECFQKLPQTDKWLPIDGTRIVTSQSGIKTGDTGVMRLQAGERMVVHIEPASELGIEQFIDEDKLLVTRLNVISGKVKVVSGSEAASAIEKTQTVNSSRSITSRRVVIAADGYTLTVSEVNFALEFERAADQQQSLASVYAGSGTVEHAQNQDNVTIRAGRQAVLIPTGVAVRAATARATDWWPQVETPTTASLRPAGSR